MPIGTVTRGDDYVVTITVTELDDTVINIENDFMFFTIKTLATDPDSAAVHQEKQTVPSGADATAGKAKFQMPNALAVGTYPYDFQWIRVASGNGEIVTLEVGSLTESQDVTQAVAV